MKKTLFAIFVTAMAFAVNANAQFSVGVGYANETIISKGFAVLETGYNGYSWSKSNEHLNGFYVEATYDWEFASAGSGDFILQPGVRYYCLTQKILHSKADVKYNTSHYKTNDVNRVSDHLLDIPVNVKYAYDFIPGTLKAYAFAGPTLSFGLAANNVTKSMAYSSVDGKEIKYTNIERYNGYTGKYYMKTYNSGSKDYEIEKGKKEEYKDYNMFDIKVALGIGVTIMENIDIKFGYNIGLLNKSFIKEQDSTKYTANTNVMYFGVGYNF